MNYLNKNEEHWEKGYFAPNVDHPVFRFYGRILKPYYNGKELNNDKLVDFGCGQGSAVNYFSKQGFYAKGVDISQNDIESAKKIFPDIQDNFTVCDSNPLKNDYYGFEKNVAIVTAIQSLYYFSEVDFKNCIQKIYDSMKPGGIFFATMMGEQSLEYFQNSIEFKDGLRKVDFKNDRMEVKDYYMFFVKDETHLKKLFHMFKPLHVGHYSAKFRDDEGDGFHYTFCGIK